MRKAAIALLLALTLVSGGGIEIVRGQEVAGETPGDAVAAYTSQKYERAAAIWSMHAEGGSAESAYRLGVMAELGHGMSADLAVAAGWYERAAENGHARAQYSLANLFSTGRGVDRDSERALDLYRRAANAGEPRAQYHMGRLYLEGGIVEQDATKAHRWFAAASESFAPGPERQRAIAARDSLSPHVSRKSAGREDD